MCGPQEPIDVVAYTTQVFAKNTPEALSCFPQRTELEGIGGELCSKQDYWNRMWKGPLCPRPPLLLSAPNQNRHATQASYTYGLVSQRWGEPGCSVEKWLGEWQQWTSMILRLRSRLTPQTVVVRRYFEFADTADPLIGYESSLGLRGRNRFIGRIQNNKIINKGLCN